MMLKKKQKSIKLTGIEAHLILYAFDAYFGTDMHGKVHPHPLSRIRGLGWSPDGIQDLRDRLFEFVAREHRDKGRVFNPDDNTLTERD